MNEAKKNAGGAGFARIEIMMGMKKLTPLLKKLSTAGITGVTVFQAATARSSSPASTTSSASVRAKKARKHCAGRISGDCEREKIW